MSIGYLQGMGVALLAAAGLALGQQSAAPAGAMRVEEPSLSQTAPPINPERESVSWQGKGKPRALTEAQKSAMRERQERMKEMVALLKEKRKALDEAPPERKAELEKELHNFILEKLDDRDGADNADRARRWEQERRARQAEWQQERMRLLQEKLQQKQQGNGNKGNGNGGNPHED